MILQELVQTLYRVFAVGLRLITPSFTSCGFDKFSDFGGVLMLNWSLVSVCNCFSVRTIGLDLVWVVEADSVVLIWITGLDVAVVGIAGAMDLTGVTIGTRFVLVRVLIELVTVTNVDVDDRELIEPDVSGLKSLSWTLFLQVKKMHHDWYTFLQKFLLVTSRCKIKGSIERITFQLQACMAVPTHVLY